MQLNEAAAQITEKLDKQLAQAILYLSAIEALAEAYRDCENLRQDPFLFSTVYEGLWDALIIRVGTMWDATKGVASLPKLAKELKRLSEAAAKPIVTEIEDQQISEMTRLKAWRNNVVAHTKLSLDVDEFDKSNEISVADVHAETDRIERLLSEANKLIGRSSTYYEVLKEDALRNAQISLARWKRS